MYPQLTRDWEARFRQVDTPWEDQDVAPGVADLVRENLSPGRSILEVGPVSAPMPCGSRSAAIA